MLDTIKRLTNHEDFADISLPVFGNAEATFEKVEDPQRLTLLQDVNAPTLQVLFASNVQFKVLVTQIKELMYAQYAKAQEWSQYLQPYFDAFN